MLVELFTSEGCSSCPPADSLLAELVRSQPVPGVRVIALAQHVDYWNGLGWKDPFSKAAFTDRQAEYVRSFHLDSSYTPQMVIDGSRQLVGNRRIEALAAIGEAGREPKAHVAVATRTSPDGGALSVEITVDGLPPGRGPAEVLLAVTERDLRSDVARGENAGRRLTHDGVVRELRRLGDVDRAGSFHTVERVVLRREWKPGNLDTVAFVQERKGRAILGAALSPAPEHP